MNKVSRKEKVGFILERFSPQGKNIIKQKGFTKKGGGNR